MEPAEACGGAKKGGGIILRADGTFSLDNQTRPGGLVC